MDEPAWARALNLAERVSLSTPDASAVPPSPDEAQRAARRLRRWQRAHGLGTAGGLDAMLDALPGGEAHLLALLGEPASALARRAGAPPGWWTTLQGVLDGERERTAPVESSVDSPAKSYWLRGFSRVTAPFVRHAAAELERRLRAGPVHRSIAVQPVLDAFTADLAGTLVSLAARVLVLELNVMRVQGRLRGDSGAERFASFAARVSSPAGRDALLTEYPVLGRLLVTRTQTRVEAVWEFLQRWHDDRYLLRDALFGGADPGRLESVRFGRGDTHQGGRSVAIARLSGGSVVYKPRPLAVHRHFNTLLRWLNDGVDGLDLVPLTVLNRGGYGWLEFADRVDCAGAEDFDRYYRRLGALMALLYALDGADFHFENLIARGDQPVLVDLETLFHQRPSIRAGRPADDPAQAAADGSVLSLGVLPILLSTAEGSIDLGGLGGDPSGTSPFPVAGWEDDGTDAMRVVRRHVGFAGGQNRPSYQGTAANPLLHLDALTGGFRAGYEAIRDRRTDLTAPEGLLRPFADVAVRTVLRPTQTYSTLLSEGNHPDVLRDALDFDRHLSLLWAFCAQVPELADVVPHELADLWNGDVPMFMSRPGSRDLWTARGQRLPDRFAQTALARVRAKLAGLGDRDLARQEWTIRAALATRPDALTAIQGAAIRNASTVAAAPSDVDGPVPEPAEYLAAARVLADRLVHLAIRDDQGHAGWLGLAPARDGTWRVGALGWDLYSGVCGVALFLDAIGRHLDAPGYRELGAQALTRLPAILDEYGRMPAATLAAVPGLGGMAGLPGLAYGLLHLAGTDQRLLDMTDRAVRLCGFLVDGDAALDVLSGSAGAIGALLAVHAHTGSAHALRTARRCGERLLATSMAAGTGRAWHTTAGSRPLTGFSHGAAGMGWALIRLGAAVGDDRFIATGLAAFRYERDEFRPDWGNWPDYRTVPGDPDASLGHMHAWCNGSAGIGLARADVLNLVDDPAVRDDLDAALAATLAGGFGHNHSQCHGDLGNAQLLLATCPTDPRLGVIGRRVLDALELTGPRCGTPYEVETPSLMTGLAGIGYGLLCLAAPDRVPAPLLAQPPKVPTPQRSST